MDTLERYIGKIMKKGRREKKKKRGYEVLRPSCFCV